MKALLGRKIGMSQVFSPQGEVMAVTLIQAEPNIITLRRNQERDGYTAIQLALPDRAKVTTDGQPKHTDYVLQREFSFEAPDDVRVLTVEQFTPGDAIEVSGTSKGKGFQGVVKRHHFKGGPASHGHTDWERRPGSIGQRFPQHTLKGKRMAGRMGRDRVTVKNLKVVAVDRTLNLLAVSGAIPGHRGSVVEIRSIVS